MNVLSLFDGMSCGQIALLVGIVELIEKQEEADKKFMELIRIKAQNERLRNTSD